MMKISSVLNYFALNKPWLYLSMFFFALMWIIVLLGNPLLPISLLAKYGWSWHHIPEFFGFFFFGMWFGDIRVFQLISSRKFNWIDIVYLLLLVAMSFMTESLIAVIPIAVIPSFLGYLTKRWYTIKKENQT